MTELQVKDYLNKFRADTSAMELPEKFTFPFYYRPHPLAILAAEQLQEHLQHQENWIHNFGLDAEAEGLVIGKMFGVLVVKDQSGALGFLAAFSGKLAGVNHLPGFVPPVFDILTETGFFRAEERVISEMNERIKVIEGDVVYQVRRERYLQTVAAESAILERARLALKRTKQERKLVRNQARVELGPEDFTAKEEELKNQSLRGQYIYKTLTAYWANRKKSATEDFAVYEDELQYLKQERKVKSAALQNKLFQHYTFLNANQEQGSLFDIFKDTAEGRPPAGAGECAAPKLLQFAFKYGLQPVALAEFWWGQAMKNEVRIHKHYYPACRGKCKPILGHMLQGLVVDDNPMLENPAEGKELTIIYEDDHLAVVNKPAEFLSVPGKLVKDSVQTRMEKRYPQAADSLIVHRLDMSTSGLLIIAKDKEIHKALQEQFATRKVSKRYVAVLEGEVEGEQGEIDLPLRLDIDDRPRQMVCDEHGKRARTRWKVIGREAGRTRVFFYPITGRTHQLRVHAAHHLGLACPIVGDDIYGQMETRLHLHAEHLKLIHPATGRKISFKVPPEF